MKTKIDIEDGKVGDSFWIPWYFEWGLGVTKIRIYKIRTAPLSWLCTTRKEGSVIIYDPEKRDVSRTPFEALLRKVIRNGALE